MTKNCDRMIIVDPGKNAVKVFSVKEDGTLDKVFSFPSKTEAKRNFRGIDGSSALQFKVEINGQKYIVGEGVKRTYNFEITKNNDHHKLCVLTAIANVVEKDNEKIDLVVGYPSSDFENEKQRKEFEELLLGDKKGEISLHLNDEKKTFTISSITVKPEGMALFPRMQSKEQKNFHIIDIGGQNVNYREYDAKGNTVNSCSLDKAGINHLEQYIKTELRKVVQADEINVSELDVLQSISDGRIVEVNNIDGYKDSAEFIEDVVCNFIEIRIIDELSGRGVSIEQKGHYIIFTGGGSLRLENYLKSLLPHNTSNMDFSKTAKWDNCISYSMRHIPEVQKDKKKLVAMFAKIVSQVKEKDFEKSRNPFLKEDDKVAL
ncbi:ParM/StbA family protein [Bacillus cereus]|uniref:Actin-like protein N-terminal domain-containing protein n=1 Tax=Bacillus thuringiensis TaxID=1428 RepID=A0A9X6Z5E2_BACTU|nr:MULTISPECIES: ParM/StbA family protein [Bacillus cereus group]HDR7922601.1 ParM/StbA family protein [Bacillus paranthracis]MCU5279857.1 ParM/StbA family protein [Bacillus cereus]MDF9599397.1 ParM/StbA family protein [Bacillus cereus]MDG1589729.1 ParM/StbA family protein [Bacillus cereus]MEC3270662.1 ParM/StbA family protein [Bacillus thuringiensis]